MRDFLNIDLTWPERICRAVHEGQFRDEDRELVSPWPTCGIGEVAPRLAAKFQHGENTDSPFEEKMLSLGTLFTTAVRCDQVQEASRLYLEMAQEARAYRKRAHRSA